MEERKRKKLDPQWINKVLDCSEEVGVSKAIIERFHYYYIKQRRVDSAKSSQITSRTKSTKN
ncbi:hypothetical protein NSQ89_20485 [Niallia sp. FSL R7-0648]|uniref:hypothetical protein n=1 Tax=Niallia sp. FSL R7-0648 TaxID=2954521 RepID=UPI0030F82661